MILFTYSEAIFKEDYNANCKTVGYRTMYSAAHNFDYGPCNGRLGGWMGQWICYWIWYGNRFEKCTKQWCARKGHDWSLWDSPIRQRLCYNGQYPWHCVVW